MKRHFVLATALLAGCGRNEPTAAPPAPPLPEVAKVPNSPQFRPPASSAPLPSQRQEPAPEEPVVRRSHHGPELETYPISIPYGEAVTREVIGFVDVPSNFEKRAKSLFDAEAPVAVVKIPGSGEADLHLLWNNSEMSGRPFVKIDRRDRVITASLSRDVSGWPRSSPRGRGVLYGYAVRLGPLEAGGWVVQVLDDQRTSASFTFVAGPGGPEAKPVPVERKQDDDLPAFLMWPGSASQHDLFVFACREEDFENVRAAAVGELRVPKPAPLKAGDELMLYALWGRRIAGLDATAQFDRKAASIRVTARWAGAAGMKLAHTAPYAGIGFKLGRLEAGTYSVEVGETTPVAPEGRRVTKKVSFEVRARP